MLRLVHGLSCNDYQQVVSADTYGFVPSFPVTLVSLQQDSVVTRVNSDVAYAYFTQQNSHGSYQENLVPNTDFMVSNGEYLPQVKWTIPASFHS